MDRTQFEQYLACFNQRDYQGVLGFWADQFVLKAAPGVTLHTPDEVLHFYKFLHAYMDERLIVKNFLCDEHFTFIEGIIRLEGIKPLTPRVLQDAGYPNLFPMDVGQVLELPQFIHYHLNDAGKIIRASCVVELPD